jgi:hypothetical protein
MDIQKREERGRDSRPEDSHRVVDAAELKIPVIEKRELLKHMGLSPYLGELGDRREAAAYAALEAFVRHDALNGYEAICVSKWKRIQKCRFHQSEHCSIAADPECQDQDDQYRDSPIPPEKRQSSHRQPPIR